MPLPGASCSEGPVLWNLPRLFFSMGTRGHCPQEILIYDRKYLWYIPFFRCFALNITVFTQMYHLQLVIRVIYTFQVSINVKVMPKCIFFSQEICQAIARPQEVTGKKTPCEVHSPNIKYKKKHWQEPTQNQTRNLQNLKTTPNWTNSGKKLLKSMHGIFVNMQVGVKIS